MYGQFFPTAEESIEYYNQKRCVDGKGLILPSQIVSNPRIILIYLYNSALFLMRWKKLQRYVKYFERILTYFNGENQPPRRCSHYFLHDFSMICMYLIC